MNIRTNLLGGAMGFAHLAGIGMGKKAKAAKTGAAENEEDKPAAEEGDEEKPKGKGAKKAKGKAEGDDDEDKTDADDDEDGMSAEDDDEEKPDASAEDDDEEEGDEPPPRSKGKKATAEYRRGVAAERKRCAAIFGAKAAAANVPLAASLAFETGMSADAAIRVLKGQPAPNSAGADRSRRNPDLGPDGAPQGSSSKNAWGAAIDKVTPNASRGGGGWGAALERTQR